MTWAGRAWGCRVSSAVFEGTCSLTHDAVETRGTARVAAQFQAIPKLDHAQGGIASAHVTDELQFLLRVLVRMVMGSAGEAGQGFNGAVPSISPEVDVGPTLVVFAAGLADAVFCCVFQKGLPEPHVLCYTVCHEECFLS